MSKRLQKARQNAADKQADLSVAKNNHSTSTKELTDAQNAYDTAIAAVEQIESEEKHYWIIVSKIAGTLASIATILILLICNWNNIIKFFNRFFG